MPKENGRLQKAVPDEPFAVRAREVGGPDGDDPAVLERSQRVQRAGQLRRRCRHPVLVDRRHRPVAGLRPEARHRDVSADPGRNPSPRPRRDPSRETGWEWRAIRSMRSTRRKLMRTDASITMTAEPVRVITPNQPSCAACARLRSASPSSSSVLLSSKSRPREISSRR